MSRVSISIPVQGGQSEVQLESQRTIDFSALDYDTSRRAIIEYIKTYFPNEFNDFIASNGLMMLIEIVSMTAAKLALRSDILAKESTLPTAFSERAVINHLALINQKIKRQTSAIVDIECTVGTPSVNNISIKAGTFFKLNGSDNNPVYYEIYRAPGDWTGDIVIPFGKRGVIAYGIEGFTKSVTAAISNGLADQKIIIEDDNILENPISITSTSAGIQTVWTLIDDPIELYGPTDRVVEYRLYDNRLELIFGDNVNGAIPRIDSIINVRYRVGGGSRGRIGAGVINESKNVFNDPLGVSTTVLFRNISPSIGGIDKETIEQAKLRARSEYSVHNSIVSMKDYITVSENYSHPYYGTVSRAMAVVDDNDQNTVNVYVLSVGGDGLPATPSQGLKDGLTTYIKQYNNITDKVNVIDGRIKAIDINMNVVLYNNSDVGSIKSKVDYVVRHYFDNWKMGQAFYLSDFISNISNIDGVKYVNLIEPVNNILSGKSLSDPAIVSSIELITLKSYKVNFYHDV